MAGFGFTNDSNEPERGENGDSERGSHDKRDEGESFGSFGNFKDLFQQFSVMGLNIQGLMSALSGKSSPQALSRELIRDISRKFLSAHGELPVSISEMAAIQEAINIADIWLSDATTFSAIPIPENCAISRRDWIDSTLPGWEELANPLVSGMTEAMAKMLNESIGDSDAVELDQIAGAFGSGFAPGSLNIPKPVLLSIMGTFVSSLISTQLGQTIGNLSTTVTGGNDVALPLTGELKPQLIPQNVNSWGDGLGIDSQEIRIFLALREVAAARLFAATPWLRQRVKNAISAYGKGIRIDITAVTEQAQEALDSGKLDPANPESMTYALTGGLFTPEETPAQKKALENLENLLALIEGWIDSVVMQAAGDRLPSIVRLSETQQRRRATKSPTTQLFASLIGLEVSPRKMREATKFWRDILALRDLKTRDEIWSESYLLPDGEQLADAESFLRSRTVPDDLSGLI